MDSLSVWEFTSTVDQISKSQRCDSDLDNDEPEDLDNDTLTNGKQIGVHELHSEHPEYLKKVQRVHRNPCKQFVPVPIGPAIPRCDRPELYAKYVQLMLILFKPWRKEADLRRSATNWPEAFDEFLGSCTKEM